MLRTWTRDDTAGLLRVPTRADDKYSRGVVALRTGSATYPGAAVLGVEAAWRAGAGYVRYLGDASDAVLARRPETVTGPDIGRLRVDAWVIGSGTDAAHRSEHEQTALRRILRGEAPVVVDAGALDMAPEATAPLVLTPHVGELQRLCALLGIGAFAADDDTARGTAAGEVARMLGATLLVKGARTLIVTPDEPVIVVDNGPGWLATAGTGDVLAGVIAALLASHPQRAHHGSVAAAAWLHGWAGTLASGSRDGATGHPIVAMDVAEALPAAIADLLA